MKKLVTVILFFLTVSLCFAKGQREELEFGIGYHYLTENTEVLGIDVKTKMPSFAINFSGISYFSENVGFGVYGNMLFPMKLEMEALGQTITVNRSDYDFLFGMDVLLGPTFVLYNNENFGSSGNIVEKVEI